MTKKDYVLIAKVIKENCPTFEFLGKLQQTGLIAESLAIEFKKENPRFDIDIFKKTCTPSGIDVLF